MIGLDNKGPNKADQVDRLLQMALDLRNRNGGPTAYFHSPLFSRFLQAVQHGNNQGKSLKDIKKDIQEKDERITQHLAANREVAEGTKNVRTKSKCTIL